MSVLEKKYKKKFDFKFQKNNLISLLIIFLIFAFDRFTKIKIINHQVENNRIYINDYTNFDLIWNTGIGFGLLSSNSNILYNLTTFLIGSIIIFIFYLIIKSEIYEKMLFSLVAGGALGNFYDRIVYLAVPDFIDIHYQRFHWFTFNIADIFITLGLILLIVKEIFLKNEK
jgi:signal peptidase II